MTAQARSEGAVLDAGIARPNLVKELGFAVEMLDCTVRFECNGDLTEFVSSFFDKDASRLYSAFAVSPAFAFRSDRNVLISY